MAIRAGRVAALLSIAFGMDVARAETRPSLIELRWSAPRECPDALRLVGAVEGFLGLPLAQAGEQQLAIDGRVHGDDTHGYAGKLSFVTAEGTTERALEHPDCRKLTEGLALLVALAIDPERVRARQEAQDAGSPVVSVADPEPPPKAAEPSPATPPAPAPVEEPAPSPRARDRGQARSAVRPSVALLGLAGDGLLPSVTAGLGLELGLNLKVFEAAVVARSWAPRSAPVPGVERASVEVSLLTAGLRLCAVPSYESWSLLACVRGDLGSMSGGGEQVDNARRRSGGFAGLGGGLGLAYTAGRFSPRAGAELLWTASRPRFGVLRSGQGIEAFQPRAWHLTGFVGLAYLL